MFTNYELHYTISYLLSSGCGILAWESVPHEELAQVVVGYMA